MRITFSFDREKPFASVRDHDDRAALVERYELALASAFRALHPEAEFRIAVLDAPAGDVEFEPDHSLSSEARLAIAVELKQTARRLADHALAASLVARSRATIGDGEPD